MFNLASRFSRTSALALLSAANLASHAGPLTGDLGIDSAGRLLHYDNPWQSGFGSPDDQFARLGPAAGDRLAAVLLDDSIAGSDNLGIIASGDAQPLFGITDTVNSDTADTVTAAWSFAIDGFSQLVLSLDMAAMGDFELSDWFRWEYRIDDEPRTVAFEGIANEQASQNYTLASGQSVTLADPLTVAGVALDNSFTAFAIDLSGAGTTLDIWLQAQVNGGTEAVAFRELSIRGSPRETEAASINVAGSLPLVALGLTLLRRRRSLSREAC